MYSNEWKSEEHGWFTYFTYMKTYAEQEHQCHTDWWILLSNPPDPLSEMHYHMIDLASRWVTCAVGQEDCRIPRKENGCPEDSELQRLGGRFYESLKVL